MRRTDAGSVIRQRQIRLKKRKTVLRRQAQLRERMLLAKHLDPLHETTEPFVDTELTKEPTP